VLLPKNRVKLLLNMMLIAAQTIPRGGQIVVDPVGEGEGMGFRVAATGLNARLPQAAVGLLAGQPAEGHTVDAHAVQPFYTGLLARNCGLAASLAAEGDAIVVSAR
jgi:histidine phosphotransferase ChpT